MHTYRKKPVVIEAFQMTAERHENRAEWPAWLEDAYQSGLNAAGAGMSPEPGDMYLDPNTYTYGILTLEGAHRVSKDDWIIKGVAGELYPCKPDIFAATYDKEGESIPGKQQSAKAVPVMDFGQALTQLKAGERVCRHGWNGKGMWLQLIPGGTMRTPCPESVYEAQPYIAMKTAQETIVPWLASQTDMLATDWEVV